MDPRFIATPPEPHITAALQLWPELAGRRTRPLLITAFGDIYLEADAGEVLLADPLELACSTVAQSVGDLERLFADRKWAQKRLMTEVLLLADERGVRRNAQQVFSVAPHPRFTGEIRVEQLVAMDLHIWHHIWSQLRARGPR